jgi:voltage-gated potassium channel
MAPEDPDPKDLEIKRSLQRERSQLLQQYDDWFQIPGLILGLIWLALLVVDLVRGLNPFLNEILNLIWILFIADFIFRLVLSPRKTAYLKENWLTALALVLPALRLFMVFHVLRIVRAAHGLRLVRVFTSLNHGVRSLRHTFARRGFGYVVAATCLVTLVGAAGMFTFEAGSTGGGAFKTYGDALFWTAMVMTTLGGAYSPVTPEGRLLAVGLAVYAVTVFGYLTATLASFFIGQDAQATPDTKSLEALQAEVQALRGEIQALTRSSPAQQAPAHPDSSPVRREPGS